MVASCCKKRPIRVKYNPGRTSAEFIEVCASGNTLLVSEKVLETSAVPPLVRKRLDCSRLRSALTQKGFSTIYFCSFTPNVRVQTLLYSFTKQYVMLQKCHYPINKSIKTSTNICVFLPVQLILNLTSQLILFICCVSFFSLIIIIIFFLSEMFNKYIYIEKYLCF